MGPRRGMGGVIPGPSPSSAALRVSELKSRGSFGSRLPGRLWQGQTQRWETVGCLSQTPEK